MFVTDWQCLNMCAKVKLLKSRKFIVGKIVLEWCSNCNGLYENFIQKDGKHVDSKCRFVFN